MSSQLTEAETLEQLLPELEAEGYEVYLRPTRLLSPRFLGDYIPDAIALRSDENLAIEVVQESPEASTKLEKIAALFEGQDKWKLRVVWATPASAGKKLNVQTMATVQELIAEVRQLAAKGHLRPSLLLAWATFEALGRLAIPEQFERPQTPARLVQVLGRDGYLTPSEADDLRRLADKRNKLIHGELQVHVSKAELERFAGVLDTVFNALEH